MKSAFPYEKAFITGGSSGIGLSIAAYCAKNGANVAIFARNPERLQKAVGKLKGKRKVKEQQIRSYILDVSNFNKVQAVMEKAYSEFGIPDLLVNCAGGAKPARFEDIPAKQFEDTCTVNIYGTWSVCRILVPVMTKGAIVNVSSVAGLVGVYGYTDYCASKFAVVGFSQALRSELASRGIPVHVLCPPDTDTPGWKEEEITRPKETRAVAQTAKLMQPDTVAAKLFNEMNKGIFMIVPGIPSKFVTTVNRLWPGLVQAVSDAIVKKAAKS